MEIKKVKQGLVAVCLLWALGMPACQTSTAPAGTADAATAEKKSLAPQRVDIRGSIIMRRYNQGQVVLEVDGFTSQQSRYNRAYVLVVPTTQIVGADGSAISLSELQQGQNVAVLLRAGGKGNLVGMGVARKVWVEERY
jgi:hypothetical protein